MKYVAPFNSENHFIIQKKHTYPNIHNSNSNLPHHTLWHLIHLINLLHKPNSTI
jgi:hypothetical protein